MSKMTLEQGMAASHEYGRGSHGHNIPCANS